MNVEIFDSGVATAAKNMATDADLLLGLKEKSNPVVHFYDWLYPSLTYGYFSTPWNCLNEEALQRYALDSAKRPTGGGIIFHSFDFAFSFLLPAGHPAFSQNTLENYSFVNRIIAEAIEGYLNEEIRHESLAFHPEEEIRKPSSDFCMAKPTVYDILSNGRKLAGGAQRRTKNGYLHQASIALLLPPDEFLEEIPVDSGIATAMKKCSYPLLGPTGTISDQELAKLKLKKHLSDHFISTLQHFR